MRVGLKSHTHTVKEGGDGKHDGVLLPGELCKTRRKRRSKALKSISPFLDQIQEFYSNNDGHANGASFVLYISPTWAPFCEGVVFSAVLFIPRIVGPALFGFV